MAKDDVNEIVSNGSLRNAIICSKCGRTLSRGEYYAEDIISKEATCMDCDDNRIFLNEENFMAIDDK